MDVCLRDSFPHGPLACTVWVGGRSVMCLGSQALGVVAAAAAHTCKPSISCCMYAHDGFKEMRMFAAFDF